MKKQGNELFVNLSLVIEYLNARGGSKQPASNQQRPSTSKDPLWVQEPLCDGAEKEPPRTLYGFRSLCVVVRTKRFRIR